MELQENFHIQYFFFALIERAILYSTHLFYIASLPNWTNYFTENIVKVQLSDRVTQPAVSYVSLSHSQLRRSKGRSDWVSKLDNISWNQRDWYAQLWHLTHCHAYTFLVRFDIKNRGKLLLFLHQEMMQLLCFESYCELPMFFPTLEFKVLFVSHPVI